MSNTTTATGKNAAGEDVTIEIPIPEVNTANAWNEAMQTGAQKAGVEIPGVTAKPAAAAAPVTEKKDDDQPKLYRASFTVNGKEMVFEGTDAAQVLSQYTSAVEAAQLATPAAATQSTVEDKKPALSAADMFDVGTKLIAGDVSGLKDFLKKSGIVGEILKEEGISLDQLKAAAQKTQTDSVMTDLTTAKNEFIEKVKAGQIDFPGGAQNEKMMGIMLARVQAEDKAAGKDGRFTVQSFERAYDLMKKEGLVFAVEKTQPNPQPSPTPTPTPMPTPKPAPSSTAIGASGGGRTETTKPQPGTRPKLELNMAEMSTRDFMTAYNAAIDQGYKENVDLFIKQ